MQVSKLIIINTKRFSRLKKGEIIDVEQIAPDKFKLKVSGGVFSIPSEDNLEDIVESNILFVPFF